MKHAPVLAAIVAALLASCATQGGVVSAAALAHLDTAERLEREGDLRGSRTELEFARSLAGTSVLPQRATRLDLALERTELAPFEALFTELNLALEEREHEAAERLLVRAEQLQPFGVAAARVTAYRNIVDARRTAESLGLALVATTACSVMSSTNGIAPTGSWIECGVGPAGRYGLGDENASARTNVPMLNGATSMHIGPNGDSAAGLLGLGSSEPTRIHGAPLP